MLSICDFKHLKKLELLILPLILVASLIACTTEDDILCELSNDESELLLTRGINKAGIEDELVEAAKNKLHEMGFDTTNMHKVDDYYIVEGDIFFCENDLLNLLSLKQHTTSVYYQSENPIKIGFDRSFSDSLLWKNAMIEVASNYSEMSGLKMLYDNNNPNIKLKEGRTFGNCALGQFPTKTTKPGEYVLIDTFYNVFQDAQKVFLIMHEIGHNLGLRHSNCLINGENLDEGVVHVPGTPSVDLDSYMLSSTCGYAWHGGSKGDSLTLDYLWPKTYTIDFAGSRPELNVKIRRLEGYHLPYSIVPEIEVNGKDFQGWHHHPTIYTPLNYETPIYTNMHLYPHWIDKRSPMTFTISTHDTAIGGFKLDRVKHTILNCKIRRGLNTWEELEGAAGTYIQITGNNGYNSVIQLNNYITALYSEEEYLIRIGCQLVPDDYEVKLCLTDALGPQDGAMGKHGEIKLSFDY